MVTKWKKISEQVYSNVRKRRGMWIGMGLSFSLFFIGLFMAASLGEGPGVFRYLGSTEYVNSILHAEDVQKAFDELRLLTADKKSSYNDMEFQGVYDFVVQGRAHLHRTNIPKVYYGDYAERKYEEYKESSYDRENGKGSALETLRKKIENEPAVWYFEKNIPYFYMWDGKQYSAGGSGTTRGYRLLNEESAYNERLIIGFTKQMILQGQERLNSKLRVLYPGCAVMILGLLGIIVCVLLAAPCLLKNGFCRRNMDLTAVLFLGCLYFLCNLVYDLFMSASITKIDWQILIPMFIEAVGFVVAALLFVYALFRLVGNGISCVRKKCERDTLIEWKEELFFSRCFLFIKKRVTGESYYQSGYVECNKKRLRFTLCLSAIVVGSITAALVLSFQEWVILGGVLVIGVCILAVILSIYHIGTRRMFLEYRELLGQIERICDGFYQSDIMVPEESAFAGEARKLSMLSGQIQETIQKQIKAEKMKIDLVTNVSHDLKTPLTSIINYVDLLSKEELTPVAADYVRVLEKKSGQLRKMIADVFDLAKASSGNMDVSKENVDLNKLLVQTLADMEQEIERAPVKVMTDITEKKAVILSDGSKLYRVLQNILENAIKYSMGGTRVFVTLWIENNEAVLQVKNVASYEMNFTSEEVLARFFRGDMARSTEGSGLGLAIAKEFTELCGGKLQLSVEGDIFCVELHFEVDVCAEPMI